MSTLTPRWTDEELERIGASTEIGLASRRADGTLRRYTTIWVVRHDDALYVRAAYGPETGWFLRAQASGEGRIRAVGLERDVTFEEPVPGLEDDLNAAYHTKYDSHGARVVATVVSPDAMRMTLRLEPRESGR